MKEAEEALKNDDKEAIDAKSQALATASHKLAEQMYAKEQAAQKAAGGDGGSGGEPKAEAGAKKDDGNVVDAEYEEVKDGKK